MAHTESIFGPTSSNHIEQVQKLTVDLAAASSQASAAQASLRERESELISSTHKYTSLLENLKDAEIQHQQREKELNSTISSLRGAISTSEVTNEETVIALRAKIDALQHSGDTERRNLTVALTSSQTEVDSLRMAVQLLKEQLASRHHHMSVESELRLQLDICTKRHTSEAESWKIQQAAFASDLNRLLAEREIVEKALEQAHEAHKILQQKTSSKEESIRKEYSQRVFEFEERARKAEQHAQNIQKELLKTQFTLNQALSRIPEIETQHQEQEGVLREQLAAHKSELVALKKSQVDEDTLFKQLRQRIIWSESEIERERQNAQLKISAVQEKLSKALHECNKARQDLNESEKELKKAKSETDVYRTRLGIFWAKVEEVEELQVIHDKPSSLLSTNLD